MSYFFASVSVFPYFSNKNICQLSANFFCFSQNFCIDLAFAMLFRQNYKTLGWAIAQPRFTYFVSTKQLGCLEDPAEPKVIPHDKLFQLKGT